MELAQKVGRKGIIPTGFVGLGPCQERTVRYDTVVCWHQAGVVSNGDRQKQCARARERERGGGGGGAGRQRQRDDSTNESFNNSQQKSQDDQGTSLGHDDLKILWKIMF